MANKLSGFALAAAAVVMLSAVASGQSTSGCTSAIVSLAPCLGYVSGSTSTPSSSCCSRLSAVVKGEPQCLCVLVNGGASSFGVTLNQTKALELPGACDVKTPPESLCNGPAKSPSAGPAPATTTPETPSSPGAPSTSMTPASTGTGSKATQTSAGAIPYNARSSQLMVIVFFLATVSFFTS